MISKLLPAILFIFAASVVSGKAEQPGKEERISRSFHFVQITIQPKEVVRAGASWRVDGSQWQDSKNILAIGSGRHLVEFAPIQGFKIPDPQRVVVSPTDRDIRIVAKFVPIESSAEPTVNVIPTRIFSNGGAVFPGSDQTGNPFVLYKLTGKITPEGAANAGARWKLDGTPNFYRSGDFIFLQPAKYTVRFKADVKGWYPDSRTIEADLRNGDATVIGNYHRTQ